MGQPACPGGVPSTATIGMLKPAQEALAWLEALGLPWFAVDAEMACHGSIATRS
jgi:thiamine biosynthesis lipoprotein